MSISEEDKKSDIVVSNSILSHISQGMYRSTAAALKELISNSYDADAQKVIINTNYPYFSHIMCKDSGEGMSPEAFINHFRNKGVGTSLRRRGGNYRTKIFNRPIIGRLGIGIFAIGQIAKSFTIESHYELDGVKSAYKAFVVLSDFNIPTVDEQIAKDKPPKDEFVAGKYELDEIEYDPGKKGFRIYTNDVRLTFINEMRKGLPDTNLNDIPIKTEDLHDKYFNKNNRTIKENGPYLETIWELSILAPLPYWGDLPQIPVDISKFREKEKGDSEFKKALNLIREKQQEYNEQKFEVRFDGINLKRFVELPSTLESDEEIIPKLYYIEFDEEIYNNRLKFKGYILGQASKHITPYELNGIQIRLRNVGIGCYDRTFLNYSEHVETMRNKWISGEIFVDEGLESALNLDRDSFNEHDEHYKVLQEKLHEKLHNILKELDSIGSERREIISRKKKKDYYSDLVDSINENTDGDIDIVFSELGSEEPTILDKGNTLTVNVGSNPLKGKKRNEVYKAVSLAYRIAIKTADKEKQIEVFDKLLKDLLGVIL